MKLPFSVFYRSDRHTYYVAFKNEETGRYLPAISTKKTKEAEAVRQAMEGNNYIVLSTYSGNKW